MSSIPPINLMDQSNLQDLCIYIWIYSPHQRYHVLGAISPLLRVIVTVPVVIHPRFFILLLARQAN